MSSAATTNTVSAIKASMSKILATTPTIDSLSAGDVESLQDMLKQLDALDVTLGILTQTLIGTVVSKFKNHATVGPTAKAMVKKWKKVAKGIGGGDNAAATSAGTTSQSSTTTSAADIDKKPPAAGKAERRASVNSATEEMQHEWASLQPYRKTTCQKLLDVFQACKSSLVKDGINTEAVEHLVVERAGEVEAAIHAKYMYQKQDYISKARSLCFNVKKNILLASQIILGQVDATELVNMTSDQLASEEKRKQIEDRTKKLMESKQLDWAAQNESKINEMCGIKGELLQASLFTW